MSFLNYMNHRQYCITLDRKVMPEYTIKIKFVQTSDKSCELHTQTTTASSVDAKTSITELKWASFCDKTGVLRTDKNRLISVERRRGGWRLSGRYEHLAPLFFPQNMGLWGLTLATDLELDFSKVLSVSASLKGMKLESYVGEEPDEEDFCQC